jgi:flavin-dependent dehydrogenase
MPDIVVAGAGPAGCRAAELLAARGLSVLLLDPRAPWEKPCGGGLTAAALRHTPELNELAPDGCTVSEMEIIAPSGAVVVVPLRSPYLVLSRLRLSHWGLDRAIAAGARFHAAAVVTARFRDDAWAIADSGGGTHHARWIVAADGAASTLRPQLAPNLRPGRSAARVAFPLRSDQLHRAVLRFLPGTEGYAWDFPRSGHHSVGVAVPAGTLHRAELDRIVMALDARSGTGAPGELHGALIATWDWTGGYYSELGGALYAVLGDAAGLADPVSGEGMDYAFRSAQLAADLFNPQDGFRRYPDAVFRAFARDRLRSRWIRRYFYRPRMVESLVHAARSSSGAAAMLGALADAVNEHEFTLPAIRGRTLRSSANRPPGPVSHRPLQACGAERR